jgi:hypothetical protein
MSCETLKTNKRSTLASQNEIENGRLYVSIFSGSIKGTAGY